MDRNFSFEEIEPDIELDIEFDKINDDNIDYNDDKTDRNKNSIADMLYITLQIIHLIGDYHMDFEG